MYTDDAILNDLEEVIRAHREYRRDRSLTNVLDVWEGKESRIGMRGLLEDLTQNPQMYNLTEGRSEILAELYKLLRYEFGELQAAKLSQNREVTRVTELKIDDFFTAVIKEITSCKLDIQNHYRRPPASSAPPPSSPASSASPKSDVSILLLGRFYNLVGTTYELISYIKTIESLLENIEIINPPQDSIERLKVIVTLTTVSKANDVTMRCKRDYRELIADIKLRSPEMWDQRAIDIDTRVSNRFGSLDDKLYFDKTKVELAWCNMTLVEQSFSELWKFLIENALNKQSGRNI